MKSLKAIMRFFILENVAQFDKKSSWKLHSVHEASRWWVIEFAAFVPVPPIVPKPPLEVHPL